MFSHTDFIDNFSKRIPDMPAAFHDSQTKAVYIDKGDFHRLRIYEHMLHEIIHTAAFHKFHADVKNRMIKNYRTGYGFKDPRTNGHEIFYRFNEAVVDKTTYEILRKHADELMQKLSITPEEIKVSQFIYNPFVNILDKIIQRIADKKGESETAVWQKLERGQFTGEMMHLRDIEKYIGKGLLKKLANIKFMEDAESDLPPEIINE